MTAADRYATPTAFRRALTDRLKSLAETSRWTLPQLQRHVAYDRLLERLYHFDRDWVVKGATALMARELGTRGTLDVDLYREISLTAAEADLRRAAAADIGDWFRFDVGAATPVAGVGIRLPVTSVVGTTTWAGFHIDLIGSGLRMTGQPEHVPPLAENAIPEVAQHGYQAYPLVDHVADKIAATYERYGTAGMPSTRYRDLVDLVSIINGASVPAAPDHRPDVRVRPPPTEVAGLIRRARPASMGTRLRRRSTSIVPCYRPDSGRSTDPRRTVHRSHPESDRSRTLGPTITSMART